MSVEKIEIHEFVEGRPNGDRATRMTDCSTFKVQVFGKGKAKPFTSFTYNCYDGFRVSVEDRGHALKEAEAHAKGLAAVVGYTQPVALRKFREKIVSQKSWVEA
jgi:hypothetical protein